MKTIEIDDDLYAYIASQTQVIGESAGDILRRLLNFSNPNNEAEMNAVSSPVEHELSDVLCSRSLHFKPTVDKFLTVLGEAAKQKPDSFKNVLSIQGRDRKYFAKSSEEIEASGTSTQPKRIPGTDYWVMTNSPTHQKAAMLQQALELTGFSKKAATDAANAIKRSK